jgi:hypothetical protein
MKRSGTVGLVLMGGAAFATTFAAGMAYFAWQKPSHAAQPQAAAPAQNCTTRPEGTQNCQSTGRGFAYYLLPSWSSSAPEPRRTQSMASTSSPPELRRTPSTALTSNAPEPRRPSTQSAALTSNARTYTPAASPSGTTRGGFGTTAQSSSYRTSAGG